MDPWSKGDYSRIIREASMVVEKVPVAILPSGRVAGRVLLAFPIVETEMRSWKRAPVSRVSRHALNIGQRVASEGSWGAQAPPRHGQGGAAPPGRLGPWWPPSSCASGSWKVPER